MVWTKFHGGCMRKQEIVDFSEKWIRKFQDKNMNFYDIFDTDEFPNECRRLEFEMDCGKEFEEKYSSDAFRNLYG